MFGSRFRSFSSRLLSKAGTAGKSKKMQKGLFYFSLAALPVGYTAYASNNAGSNVSTSRDNNEEARNLASGHTIHAAGDPMSAKHHMLGMGANALQKFAPINSIHLHQCGFHFYSGDVKRQVNAHHYCSHLNEDIHQCVIYDTAGPDAKLIGVEYIISRKLFESLPDDEKLLWHSHRYEVESGTLIAPRIPKRVETELMKDLQDTYGKTWHFWQVDRGDPLPLGIPQLMMALTKDGQVDPELVRQRDAALHVDTEKRRLYREQHIKFNEKHPDADAWERGQVVELQKVVKK